LLLRNEGYAYYWFKYVRRERALQGKSKIKTCSKLKSYMDVRFNPYQPIEELLEEKPMFSKRRYWFKKKSLFWLKMKTSLFCVLMKKRDKQNMVIDESSPRAPNLESTSPKPHIEETIEVQLYD